MKMYAEREYFLFFKTLYCKYLSIPNHELLIILTLECIGAEGRRGGERGGGVVLLPPCSYQPHLITNP